MTIYGHASRTRLLVAAKMTLLTYAVLGAGYQAWPFKQLRSAIAAAEEQEP